MHDGIELRRHLGVDRRDRLVEGACKIAVESDRAGQSLLDKVLDEILGAIGLRLLRVGDDLFKQTRRRRLGRRGRTWLAGALSHLLALRLFATELA